MVWYAALDSVCLAAIACLSIASGLGGGGLCHGLSVVTVLVLFAQLAVVVCARPHTSTFSHVYACTMLALTCGGALAQVTFMFIGSKTSTSGLWLVDASAACSLAVVGVTAVKLLLDCAAVVDALRRRLVLLRHVEDSSQAVALAALLLHERCDNGEAIDSAHAAEIDDATAEGVLHEDVLGSHKYVLGLEFWDTNGNAIGTGGSNEDARVESLAEQIS